MENFLKIKKRKFVIFLLIFFNQFLLNGYALNYKKIDLGKSDINNLQRKFHRKFSILLAEKNENELNNIKKESKRIEDFLEETFSSKEFEELKNQKITVPLMNDNVDELDKESTNDNYEENKIPLIKNDIDKLNNQSKSKNIEKNNSTKKKKKYNSESQDKAVNLNKKNLKLPLPSRSKISTSEFNVPSRGYVKLNGPKITLNFQKNDAIETLKLIAKLGNYGIVIIQEKDSNEEKSLNLPKITANFENVDISDVFNVNF